MTWRSSGYFKSWDWAAAGFGLLLGKPCHGYML